MGILPKLKEKLCLFDQFLFALKTKFFRNIPRKKKNLSVQAVLNILAERQEYFVSAHPN